MKEIFRSPRIICCEIQRLDEGLALADTQETLAFIQRELPGAAHLNTPLAIIWLLREKEEWIATSGGSIGTADLAVSDHPPTLMAVTRADGEEFEMSAPDDPSEEITFDEEGMHVPDNIMELLPDEIGSDDDEGEEWKSAD